MSAFDKLDHYLNLGLEEHEGAEEAEDDTANVHDEAGQYTAPEVEVPEVQAVTDDQVDDAEDNYEEASTTVDEAEDGVDEVREDLTEMDEARESLEFYQTILQHGLDNQQYSPQAVATIQHGLEKFGATFGVSGEVTALEDYGTDDASLALYYEAGLESVDGFLKRLASVVDRPLQNLGNSIDKWSEGHEKKAKALNTKADAVLNDLSKVKSGSKATFKLSTSASSLRYFGGQDAKTINEALDRDFKAQDHLVGSLLRDSATYHNQISEKTGSILGKINTDNSGTAEEIAKMKHPLQAIPDGYTKPGKMARDTYVEKPDSFKDPRKIKSLKIVSKYGSHNLDKEVEVSKDDVVKTVQMVKKYAALAMAANKQRGQERLAIQKNAALLKKMTGSQWNVTFSKDWKNAKALDDISGMVWSSAVFTVSTHGQVIDQIFEVAEAALSYATKAAKKVGKAEKKENQENDKDA